MSSIPFQPDLLSLISCDSCAEGATSVCPERVSGHTDTVSVLWQDKKRLATYTNAELVEMRKIAIEHLEQAKFEYSVCSRHKKAYWFNQTRNWGGKWARCSREMAKRGILYDPKGKWSRPSGKKGDAKRV